MRSMPEKLSRIDSLRLIRACLPARSPVLGQTLLQALREATPTTRQTGPHPVPNGSTEQGKLPQNCQWRGDGGESFDSGHRVLPQMGPSGVNLPLQVIQPLATHFGVSDQVARSTDGQVFESCVGGRKRQRISDHEAGRFTDMQHHIQCKLNTIISGLRERTRTRQDAPLSARELEAALDRTNLLPSVEEVSQWAALPMAAVPADKLPIQIRQDPRALLPPCSVRIGGSSLDPTAAASKADETHFRGSPALHTGPSSGVPASTANFQPAQRQPAEPGEEDFRQPRTAAERAHFFLSGRMQASSRSLQYCINKAALQPQYSPVLLEGYRQARQEAMQYIMQQVHFMQAQQQTASRSFTDEHLNGFLEHNMLPPASPAFPAQMGTARDDSWLLHQLGAAAGRTATGGSSIGFM